MERYKKKQTCLLLEFSWLLFVVFGIQETAAYRGGNVTVITALANSTVSLPCDISIPNAHERVTFILWYREDLGIPIFSMEVGPDEVLTSSIEALSTSVIWSDEKWLGARAHFRPETFPATLRVDDVKGSDAGQYRCRVDFTDAPTRNTLVNLTVIVPPDPVVIFDETGKRRATVVGPYLVGSTIHLVCDAFGGNPLPRVTWSKSGRLIDETYHILSNGTVRNEITFHNVDRSFLRTRLTCEASNTNLSRPIRTTVDVDMNFVPVTVNIVNKVDRLVVGRESEIVCRSTGSRPPAHITWYLGGQRLEGGGTESASSDGNATVSILSFRPKMEHIGQSLVCKATNPLITQSDLFDNVDLNIDYAPRVELALGKSISPGSIYEGGDVYFDCLVVASPKPSKILWFQDDKQLHHNTVEGVILTNRSLVLQGIDRTRSGGYTCQAINAVGNGQSQVIELDVKYVPVCKNGEPVVHGVGKGEMVDVYCDVVANPNVEGFHWAFNNSAGLIHVPAVRATTVNGTRSKLTYTPRNNKDYGTLMCEAKNEVGKQKHPCIFHIILAVAPEPVANCSAINPSAEHFRLSCKPGFDGGMEQFFEVIVRENNSGAVVYNTTTTDQLERLDVGNLSAGMSYIATVTPFNKKGPGQSINFEFDTIMHPKVEVTQVEDAASAAAASGASDGDSQSLFDNDWMVMIGGILAGGLVSFGLFLLVGLVCVQVKKRRNPGPNTSAQNKNQLLKQQTEVVVPHALGDGSIIGTTVIQPQHSQATSSAAANNVAATRKGILKRSNHDTSPSATTAQNSWDYELSPGKTNKVDSNILHLPMGLPPPPPSSTSAAAAISDDCELCLSSASPPPPPPLVDAPAGFSPANNGGMRLQPLMKQPPLAFLGSSSRTLPRRVSREGLLNEAEVTEIDLEESMHQLSRGDGSTDPLLQIPTQLSAVLTMKRSNGSKPAQMSAVATADRNGSRSGLSTPLLKRKRESIV